MFLGSKQHTAGNATRYSVDYSDWLEDGVSLTGATIVLSPAFTATVTDVAIANVVAAPSHHVFFTLTGGSVNENFTLDAQITDSRGERKNDTLGFTVVAP